MHRVIDWLNANAGAAQVLLALVLAGLTLGYVILTARLVARGTDNVELLRDSVRVAQESNDLSRDALAIAQTVAAEDRLHADRLYKEALKARLDGVAPVIAVQFVGADFRLAPDFRPEDVGDEYGNWISLDRAGEFWRLTLRFVCTNFGGPAAVLNLTTPEAGRWLFAAPDAPTLPVGRSELLLSGKPLEIVFDQKQTLKYFFDRYGSDTPSLVARSTAPGGAVTDTHTWQGKYQAAGLHGEDILIAKSHQLVAGPLAASQERTYLGLG